MIRCTECLMPDTRPDTVLSEDGVCPACINFKNRPSIDWAERKNELIGFLDQSTRSPDGFDCIVPSSGGKDSTYQVLTLIELGAKPLVVTAATCHLTALGRANIDNLSRYATTIEVTPNRRVRAKLNRIGAETVGDISWPEHVSIFTTPFRVAKRYEIPLIFYGECPQAEYSGPKGSELAKQMTRRWRSEFGGFLGLRPDDCVGQHGITTEDMDDYRLPDDTSGIYAYFLGQFIEWDSRRNAEVAAKAGMKSKLPCPANWWTEENQDNAQTGLHDYQGYRKYGYGRACVQLSVDIRNNRISRDLAAKHCDAIDGLFPDVYAGVPVEDVLANLEMTRQELDRVLDKFTNWHLFSKNTDGTVSFNDQNTRHPCPAP